MESLGFELAPSKSKPISLTHIYRLLVVGDGPSKPIYLIISSSPFTTPSLYHSRFHLCQNPSNVQDLFPTYPLLAHWIPSGWIESATHCASKTSSSSYKTCKNSAMASVSCTSTSINLSPTSFNSRPPLKLGSQFLGLQSNLRWVSPIAIGPSNGSRATCWFNLRQNAEGAGIYGSQSRDDFIRDDVEQYFNYMGMLAVEGTYDKMEALLSQDIHPVDILLMLAASEGDKPKLEELLKAGAKYDVKDVDGRTAIDRAPNQEIKDFILNFSVEKL